MCILKHTSTMMNPVRLACHTALQAHTLRENAMKINQFKLQRNTEARRAWKDTTFP